MPIYSDVIARLDDRSVQDTLRSLESQFENSGTSLGETFSRAFSVSGSNFSAGLMQGIRQGVGAFGELGTAAESSMGRAAVGAAGAGAAMAAVAVAVVKIGEALYDVGAQFDAVSDSISNRTNSLGADMDSLNNSLHAAFRQSSSSLEEVGDVLTRVSQSLHLTGEPLSDVTAQIDTLNRMTGQQLNVRDYGRVLAQFGIDASLAGPALDGLYAASAKAGIPLNELTANLVTAGPAARTLGLNLGELTNLFTVFESGGIAASSAQMSLNNAAKVFADSGIPLQTGLADTITQIRGYIDVGNQAAAIDLAGKVFGERGAERFVDLIRQGKLTVEQLNTEIAGTGDAIARQDEATRGWQEEWEKLKNNTKDLADNIGGPLFDALDKVAQKALEFGNNMLGPDALAGKMPFWIPQDGVDFSAGGGLGGGPNAQRQRRGLDDPPYSQSPQDIAAALAAAGSGGPGAPQIPYPADYGQPPRPGETIESWQHRMQVMDAQHDVATKQAALNQLESANVVDQNALTKARNDLLNAQIRQTQVENQQVSAAQADQAQVPYPAGYGAAPRAGQTARQYGAEQAVYEAQHKTAEAQARLTQVQSDATATAEDLVAASNALAKARVDENQAQMRLIESSNKATDSLGQIGAQIDADFGASKGLSGIVENLTKMLANVAAAPVIGALSGAQIGLGYKPGEAGSGLMSILAAGGAFGDQYTGGGQSSATAIAPYTPAATSSAAGAAIAAVTAANPNVAAMLALAQSSNGGTYAPASNLANGLADCSGAISDLYEVLTTGESSPQRMFTTTNFATDAEAAKLGFLPGYLPGALNVGVNPYPGNSGHMAATLPNGVNFESGGGGAGIRYGGGAAGALDPQFEKQYYLPTGATPASAAGAINLGGQSIPLPLPVTIVGGGFTAPLGIPGTSGGPGAGPGGAGAPGLPGGASASGSGLIGAGAAPGATLGSLGGGYLPLTPSQLTDPGLTDPIPASAGPANPGVPGAGGGTGGGGFFPGLGGPPQSGPGLALPGVGGGPGAGSTLIGGLAPPEGTGGGFSGIGSGGILGAALGAASSGAALAATAAAGGMDGGAGGAAASAAMQIGIQLLNRAVAQGGQVAGIAASGIVETLLPFGSSELAQNNWLTKIVGGIVGARPVLPNLAGGNGKKTPEGLTPEQAAQFESGQPTPEDVAGKPAAAKQGGGGGGTNVTNNLNITNQGATPDQTGRDATWHLGQMYSGPGQ